MKYSLLFTLGFIVLLMAMSAASPAGAQPTAPGPYYAIPSWDQQLPVSTRFIILSNWGSTAVLDRETGLVWERSPSSSGRIWDNAQSSCNVLTVGNRMGWRLPTLQELLSLVDPSVKTGGLFLPAGHPFNNVQPSTPYWSATTSAHSTNLAWEMSFGVYYVGVADKTQTSDLVWCVRGGQGVDPQ